MRGTVVFVLVLGSVAASGGKAARPQPPASVPDAFSVQLVAARTPAGGATSDDSSAGSNLRIGEEGTMYLLTGRLDSAGRPVDALCVQRVGSGTETPTAGFAHAWRVTAKLLEATMESVTVAVAWSREDVDGSGARRVEVRDHQTVTMREGERHTLDYLPAPGKADDCGSNLRVDVTASVVEDERMRQARIHYELWLMDEVPGRPAELRRFEATGRHGEKIEFHFDPLRWKTGAFLDDVELEVLAEISGTMRGRVREDGTVEAILDASRNIGLGKGGHAAGGIGDGGRKSVRIAPGETLGLLLPPAEGSHALTIDGMSNVVGGDSGRGVSPSGIDRTDREVVVSFGRFLAAHRMSLRLTATRLGD